MLNMIGVHSCTNEGQQNTAKSLTRGSSESATTQPTTTHLAKEDWNSSQITFHFRLCTSRPSLRRIHVGPYVPFVWIHAVITISHITVLFQLYFLQNLKSQTKSGFRLAVSVFYANINWMTLEHQLNENTDDDGWIYGITFNEIMPTDDDDCSLCAEAGHDRNEIFRGWPSFELLLLLLDFSKWIKFFRRLQPEDNTVLICFYLCLMRLFYGSEVKMNESSRGLNRWVNNNLVYSTWIAFYSTHLRTWSKTFLCDNRTFV
jgi:hypothetical protein